MYAVFVILIIDERFAYNGSVQPILGNWRLEALWGPSQYKDAVEPV